MRKEEKKKREEERQKEWRTQYEQIYGKKWTPSPKYMHNTWEETEVVRRYTDGGGAVVVLRDGRHLSEEDGMECMHLSDDETIKSR